MPLRVTLAALCFALIASAGCSSDAAKRRYLANGDAFIEAGQIPEAIVEYLNAVGQDPLWGEARYKLAEAYAANSDPENAFRQYVRAADLMPDDPPAQIRASAYLLLAGQFEDARTRAERLLARDPKNVEAVVVRANALAGLRNLDGAIEQLNEAIALDPARGQTYTNLALVKVAQGQWNEAKAAFEHAVEADPKSIPARLALANFQWSSGDADAALKSLSLAYEQESTNPVTNRALAAFYRANGQVAEAERHLKFLAASTALPADQFALADFYIAYDRLADAQDLLKPLTMQVASVGGAEIRLAGIEYGQGRHAEAHKILDRFLAREPNSAMALLQKARWLMQEGHVDQAVERATSATAASPRLTLAYYIRGLAQVQSHRTADAIKSFSEVLRLNPRAAAAQVQLANLHLRRNAVDTAAQFADDALKNAPNSLDAHLVRVRVTMARGDLKQSRAALAALKKRAPDVAAVSALEGTLELRAGDARAARAALERTLQLDPTSMEALAGITALDVIQNRGAEARARIETRLTSADHTPELLLLAAKTYVANRDFQRAEELLRESIAVDPLDTANFALLGRVLQERNTLDAAKAEFDQVAAREPGNLPARLMSAMIVHTQGDLEQAKARYADVLKLEPRAAMAANNLASIYADSGENLDLAQKLAETAAEQLPAAPEIQDTLGWVYLRRQLNGQAITRFQQSIAGDSANPVYHYHLGLAYSRNGDRDRARTEFQKALALFPGYAEAKQALAALGN